jgi:hypothetical protein
MHVHGLTYAARTKYRYWLPQTMNTLGYISRQYDALASTPTTPTSESAPLSSPFGQLKPSRSQDDTDMIRLGRNYSPKLHRTKSLSRTRHSPPEAATEADMSQLELVPPTSDKISETSVATLVRLRRRRFILVRLLIGIWNGLCALWSLLPAWKRVRHNFGLIALRSDDTSDEKEDNEEEEDDPLVARASPPEKQSSQQRISFAPSVEAKPTSRSRHAKPPTPVVSPSDLVTPDSSEEAAHRRTPSLSFTPPTPASVDASLPQSPAALADPTPPASSTPLTRPRASSTLLPNPLSASLLTLSGANTAHPQADGSSQNQNTRSRPR